VRLSKSGFAVKRRLCTAGDLEVTLRIGIARLLLYVRASAVALALIAVTGCSRDNPQAELEAAVQRLQDNLEAKSAGAVLDQLAADFQAQSELDREWAKRKMTVLFLQNANAKVVALTRSSRITGETSGETDAQVVLAGGQGRYPRLLRAKGT
jgi:hypothetical protein